jgi:formylglycine-generating enzyme required for sulfatase activity
MVLLTKSYQSVFFGVLLITGLIACKTVEKKTIIHCYAPGNSGIAYVDSSLLFISVRNDTSSAGMVWVGGGTFRMGASGTEGYPEEYPQHPVTVNGFWMDSTEVTNASFAAFVQATGYITTAERKPDWEILKMQLPPGTPRPHDSILVPGSLVFSPPHNPVPLNDPSQWWKFVAGANWKHPEGPGSDLEGKENHPVVQVSWEDAMAYCKWSGKRLPAEAEWEWAAKSGKRQYKFAWGNSEFDEHSPAANIWQGRFPDHNTLLDRYFTTAPVQSFPPNSLGLYDLSGNVWEWCADWMDAGYYSGFEGQTAINPGGPVDGAATSHPWQKVIKGGSFLCHASYCTGYRTARRSSNGWDSGSNHTGFRCVK